MSIAVVLLIAGLASGMAVAPASAHPLGNFTISHYHGLTVSPDRIDILSVLDRAEIPTVQATPSLDTDGDGQLSPRERNAGAEAECPLFAGALVLAAGGERLALTVVDAELTTTPGAAGLLTMRLTCELSAEVDLGQTSTVSLRDGYLVEQIGWREITARGSGVGLIDPVVPDTSISNELREYPEDLLSSPLATTEVELAVRVGGAGGVTSTGPGVEGLALSPGGGDPISRFVAAGDARLQSLVAADQLTVGVGLLAVALAMLLGAGHAAMPGHGKTVMAAYLAGRRGRPRDALVVGATVTLTHTIGVLVIGLFLSVVGAVAGEDVLQVLGVASGVLIIAVGAFLLRDAWRDRRSSPVIDLTEPEPVVVARAVQVPVVQVPVVSQLSSASSVGVTVASQVLTASPTTTEGSSHGHEHTPSHSLGEHGARGHSHGHGDSPEDGDSHGHGHNHADSAGQGHSHGHSHGRGHGHSHGLGHSHSHQTGFGRRGLIGLGVAGGLVPSPSALVVLLGAIALGRSVFGVLLVFAYGVGMAATLTAVGLLLVRTQQRLSRLSLGGRMAMVVARIQLVLPVATAALVIVVGIGLAARSFTQ